MSRVGTAPEFKVEVSGMDRFPMEGVEVWINPSNKFLVFQLHYSANPAKNDDTYRANIKSSMPRAQYMQEYELQWDSFSGLPVYQDFQEHVHGSKTRLEPEIGLPLLRGWDFGLTPACVIAQLQGDQLVVLQEYVEVNMGAKRFAERVLKDLALKYPEWGNMRRDWLDYADPSGSARKDTDEGTCFGVLTALGLKINPGVIAFEARKSSVEHFLISATKGVPNFQIDLSTCPVLVRGFKGGYRFPETAEEIEPTKLRPIKDEHSHPHDALQMITCRLVQMRSTKRVRGPDPMYSFNMAQGGSK